ncbi:hypothetical protein DFQ26_005623 [Actinomortierella ambigua]|nr:hypothetical protein DFQ26_005623 [Actinomortierella ambigua]
MENGRNIHNNNNNNNVNAGTGSQLSNSHVVAGSGSGPHPTTAKLSDQATKSSAATILLQLHKQDSTMMDLDAFEPSFTN